VPIKKINEVFLSLHACKNIRQMLGIFGLDDFVKKS